MQEGFRWLPVIKNYGICPTEGGATMAENSNKIKLLKRIEDTDGRCADGGFRHGEEGEGSNL